MNKIKFKWGQITAVEKSYLTAPTGNRTQDLCLNVPPERWYVKPETFGSIPAWGSRITFLNSSDSTSFELNLIYSHTLLKDNWMFVS